MSRALECMKEDVNQAKNRLEMDRWKAEQEHQAYLKHLEKEKEHARAEADAKLRALRDEAQEAQEVSLLSGVTSV